MNTTCETEINSIIKKIQGKIMRIDGKEIQIHIDNKKHISEIAKLYEMVHISNRELSATLDRDHENSFYKAGGLFDKRNEDDLCTIIDDKRKSIATLTLDDEVIGMLAMKIDLLDFQNIKYNENATNILDFRKAMTQRKVLNPMEIIFSEKANGSAYALLYLVCNTFYEQGYKYWAVEIWTIHGYEEGDSSIYLNHRNNPSSTLVENIGGVKVGNLSMVELNYDTTVLTIERNIYSMDMKNSLEIMKRKSRNPF